MARRIYSARLDLSCVLFDAEGNPIANAPQRSGSGGVALSGGARSVRDPARIGRCGSLHGGDGVIRRLRLLEPMTPASLSGRRRVPSHGMAGGLPGAFGHNWVERVHGARVQLDGADKTETTVGGVFVIETPGGRGDGTPE